MVELNQEKNRDLRNEEMVKLEKMIEQQKALIEDSLKFQQDNQKTINREKRILQQQTKTVSNRFKELAKKEEVVLLQRQKMAEDQALLLAREERLDKREKDLALNREMLSEILKMLEKQKQAFLDGTTQLKILNTEMEGKSLSLNTEQHPGQVPSNIITAQKSLLEQQQKLLDGMESFNLRLEQDKTWIKSLLKGLLDQQEKFQRAEERIREREKEAMHRQETDLKQKRGWIKVEKAKLRKSVTKD